MRELILEKLKEIEKREDIRILHAVESGSRAWGFPSPGSDYDVRFLYIRRPEFYLKLEKTRDVVELPVSELLDINGWDLNKALRLLYGSNPTLFEWLACPIVYRQTDFSEAITPLLDSYFSCRNGLYHYLNTAEGNYRNYLREDTARAKKYLYALRAVLACRWILEKRTRPPVAFAELMASQLEESLKPQVERLLDLKMNAPEIKEIPRADSLNRYLEESITELKARAAALPAEHNPDWAPLNDFFLGELNKW